MATEHAPESSYTSPQLQITLLTLNQTEIHLQRKIEQLEAEAFEMPPRGPTYKTLEKDIRRLYSEQYNLHPEMNRLRTELKRRRGTKEWKDHLKEWGPYYDMLNEQLGANPKQW